MQALTETRRKTASLPVSLAVMAVLLLLDQVSKLAVRLLVPLHHSNTIIPHLVELTHVENPGVSFSFLGDVSEDVRVPLLVTISLVAVAALATYWLRNRPEMNAWSEGAFVLILPGALGNLIDRAVYGTVTDFFHFHFYGFSFFVNNVADILISLGVLVYLFGLLQERRGHAPGP